jgi:hypothetical protein
MSSTEPRTDAQIMAIDVRAALADGRRSGEIIVAAALQADQIEVQPRALEFLAEIVRRGGVSYAARLPEPLPTERQSALVRPWLDTGGEDAEIARWLEAVATALAVRRGARLTGR